MDTNFKVKSGIDTTWVYNPLIVSTQEVNLYPNAARMFEYGEWLEDAADGRIQRGGTGHAVNAEVSQLPCYPFVAEGGRTDIQVTKRLSIIRIHGFEARTKIVDLTGLVVGSLLQVQNVTINGVRRRALALHTNSPWIQGYVTRVYTDAIDFINLPTPIGVLQ